MGEKIARARACKDHPSNMVISDVCLVRAESATNRYYVLDTVWNKNSLLDLAGRERHEKYIEISPVRAPTDVPQLLPTVMSLFKKVSGHNHRCPVCKVKGAIGVLWLL